MTKKLRSKHSGVVKMGGKAPFRYLVFILAGLMTVYGIQYIYRGLFYVNPLRCEDGLSSLGCLVIQAHGAFILAFLICAITIGLFCRFLKLPHSFAVTFYITTLYYIFLKYISVIAPSLHLVFWVVTLSLIYFVAYKLINYKHMLKLAIAFFCAIILLAFFVQKVHLKQKQVAYKGSANESAIKKFKADLGNKIYLPAKLANGFTEKGHVSGGMYTTAYIYSSYTNKANGLIYTFGYTQYPVSVYDPSTCLIDPGGSSVIEPQMCVDIPNLSSQDKLIKQVGSYEDKNDYILILSDRIIEFSIYKSRPDNGELLQMMTSLEPKSLEDHAVNYESLLIK